MAPTPKKKKNRFMCPCGSGRRSDDCPPCGKGYCLKCKKRNSRCRCDGKPGSKCKEHGMEAYTCSRCPGKGYCSDHKSIRYICPVCPGPGWCRKHRRQISQCLGCGKGGNVCSNEAHGGPRVKSLCHACFKEKTGGLALCAHGQDGRIIAKTRCRQCTPTQFCPHNVYRPWCFECRIGYRWCRCPERKYMYSCGLCLSTEQTIRYKNFCNVGCGTRLSPDRLAVGLCLQCSGAIRGTKQARVLEALLPLVPPPSSVDNATVGGAACDTDRLRPDVSWVGEDRVVVLEIDEHGHTDRDATCELARMQSMRWGSENGEKPLVVLRFNPDGSDHPPSTGENASASDFASRAVRLGREIDHWLRLPHHRLHPIKVTVIYMDYRTKGTKHPVAARANEDFEVLTPVHY